jgi:geranylgeranyl pyrophosphate synthase
MTDAQQPNSPARSALLADIAAFCRAFDPVLGGLIASVGDAPPRLVEAMRYTALLPGKRIRPFLVARCCELTGGRREDAWHACAAVECVHAFSLIHDDLPAMDDDDLRRGRPTNHKVFGEDVAILAGDGLVVLAFALLARHGDAGRAIRMVRALAIGAGASGMIGGQTADVLGEREPASLDLATYIHERKTAALFAAACQLGAIAGGAGDAAIDALGLYGRHIGRAFQIADDLLDVTSSAAQAGKNVGKDAAAGKQTFPRCVGMQGSRDAAADAVRQAVDALSGFGPAADDLRALAAYVIERDY